MGCFEKIAFVDNEREGAIGKLEDVESFYPEYNCAIAACDDGVERLEWNKKLEALYNIPVLFHMDSTISPSADLLPGCIVEPRAVVGCGSTIGQATVIGANVVEKGTTNGTITDAEGRFSLNVASDATLREVLP